MKNTAIRSLFAGLFALPLLANLAAAQAAQQLIYSIDWHGPTIAMAQPGAAPITEGDLLTRVPAFGPFPQPPNTFLDGGALGLSQYPVCVGHPPGTPCGVELDALSRGEDLLLLQTTPHYLVLFSTDEFAVGLSTAFSPSVATEAPVGDSSADVWDAIHLPVGPVVPKRRLSPWTLSQ